MVSFVSVSVGAVFEHILVCCSLGLGYSVLSLLHFPFCDSVTGSSCHIACSYFLGISVDVQVGMCWRIEGIVLIHKKHARCNMLFLVVLSGELSLIKIYLF